MSDLPCRNQSCHSYGKPHPNCKCYGGMAEGGDVDHFCSKDQMHKADCQYYKDGGEVNTGWENPIKSDEHTYPVAGFLAHQGIHGILKMNTNHDLGKYEHSVKRGHKHLDDGAEALFSGEKREPLDKSKSREAIHDWISKGGVTHDTQQEIYKQQQVQGLAEGGEVKNQESKGLHSGHPIATAYPEQNMMLQAAKGRVSNYLTSMQPQQNQAKLAFDRPRDQTHEKKSYERALDIAAHPLGVLDKIQQGNIHPEHLRHLNSMYPELSDVMQKKMTKRITEAQLKGEKPDHVVRQGLSMMMGTPLSGELTPQNIQAAQATFKSQQAPPTNPQTPDKKKKSTSSLSKVDQSYLTGNQARIERQQKQ